MISGQLLRVCCGSSGGEELFNFDVTVGVEHLNAGKVHRTLFFEFGISAQEHRQTVAGQLDLPVRDHDLAQKHDPPLSGVDMEHIRRALHKVIFCGNFFPEHTGVAVFSPHNDFIRTGLRCTDFLNPACVTIPAGEMAAKVRVRGNYDKIEATDSLGFVLRLVMPEQLEWDLYPNGSQTKVVMYKSCPFDVNNFSGWCVMTSLLLYNYPGENTSYQRLVKADLHPTEENTIILRNCFYDGYDVKMRFDASNPAQPKITMDEDQVLSDEASVFGMIHGDNKLLGTTSPYNESYFNSCQRFAVVWLYVYVKNLGTMVGTVGNFYNIFEWVSDEEAERLQREDGM